MSRISNYYFEIRYRLLKFYWGLFDRNKYQTYCDVLMFHHVSDVHIDINESCQCKRRQFRSIIENRLNQGYQFISLDKLEEHLNNGTKGLFCTVTFDDVPDNFYTAALPMLEEFSIPFCLFIATDYMHKVGYLSEDQVVELSKHPLCTIGAHTCTHPQLRKISDSTKELTESKIILENLIGKEIKFLAYPFGRQSSISHKIQRDAKKAGYALAFSTIPTSINIVSVHSKYFLPRVLK